jgi:oligoendopeptidase F
LFVIDTQKVPRRDEVPVEHTWDLTMIYASDDTWEQDVAKLEQMLPELATLQGTLANGPQALLKVLQTRDRVYMLLEQSYVYAMRRRDSDSTDAQAQALAERAGTLIARISAAAAFVEPEILALPDERIAEWLAAEPALRVYTYSLEELARQRAHVRSTEAEELLAAAGDVARAPGTIFDMLTEADLTFGMIEDEDGTMVQLSQGRYNRFMESNIRRVRHDAFKTLYKSFGALRNTLGTTLSSEIRTHVFYARARNYGSCLEASLKPHDIPLDVYTNLVATVDQNLSRLHRYMEIRKRMMGLDELHIYDLYASLVPEVDVTVEYDEAIKTVQRAFTPLGAEYGAALQQAFNNRWIDIYENVGKASGAYSDGAYTTVPFILLNYQDRLNDMFTLAHELGHSMHSFFTRGNQPYVYGNYTLFVAEVASTLNEALLTDHLLKTRDDPALRKYLIVGQLEDIRTTLFRQAMFATFELDIHQRAEAGEPLTTERMSELYRDLVARYHGPAVVLDDEIALEWARIPHFYRSFYVYQYATGISAALALSKQIMAEGQPAIDRYLRFLRSGSSRSSIDLLRDAGVDMTTPQPIQDALDTFDALLDELEALN